MKLWQKPPLTIARTWQWGGMPVTWTAGLPCTQTFPSRGLSLPALAVSALVLFAILLAGCGSDALATPTPTRTPEMQVQQVDTPTSTPLPPTATPTPENLAPYTGLPVTDPSLLNEPPILVCLNNDTVSRSSHYGLNEADVTFEYIIDGFLATRITSMFQSNAATRIGPVRSARWPNIHTTYMFDGVLACSGGSDGIRYLLKNEVGFPYLDADTEDPHNLTYFFSLGDSYRTRLQTSVDRVRRWVTDMSQTCRTSPLLPYCLEIFSPWLTAQFDDPRPRERASFSFNETPPDFSAAEATTIRIPYPDGNGVEWRYDPERGGYLRFQSGAPHFDQTTGQQISSNNVVVVFADHELTDIEEDSLGTLSVKIHLYGFGDLRLFRNGQVYEGTWRANDQSPPRWFGPGEQEIALKPGRTWIQVVRKSDRINYQ